MEPSISDIVSKVLRGNDTRKVVTFRRFGQSGELKRPMFHRFEVKGGITRNELLAESIYRNNSLLQRLMGRI